MEKTAWLHFPKGIYRAESQNSLSCQKTLLDTNMKSPHNSVSTDSPQPQSSQQILLCQIRPHLIRNVITVLDQPVAQWMPVDVCQCFWLPVLSQYEIHQLLQQDIRSHLTNNAVQECSWSEDSNLWTEWNIFVSDMEWISTPQKSAWFRFCSAVSCRSYSRLHQLRFHNINEESFPHSFCHSNSSRLKQK